MTMNDERPPGPARISTRAEFEAAVVTALLALPEGSARELRLVDIDFGDWPLGRPDVQEALARWLRRPGRRLGLVALRYDVLERRHPRFAAWRRDWAHAIEALSPAELEPDDMPCLLLAGGRTIELFDRVHWRGVVSDDLTTAHRARERIDAISQRCEAAWPVNVLGL